MAAVAGFPSSKAQNGNQTQIEDPLSPTILSTDDRNASHDTAVSQSTIQPPPNKGRASGSSSPPSSKVGISKHPRRDFSGISESSFTTTSPFNDEVSDSSAVYGDEDIGLAAHESWRGGWLAHSSTDRLTEDVDSRNGYQSHGAQSGVRQTNNNSKRLSVRGGTKGKPSPAAEGDDEDTIEARQIEQNLERWAAAERQRRKAARSSRGQSMLGPPESAGNSLARRLSQLGRKASVGALLPESTRSGKMPSDPRSSTTGSVSSADSYASDGTRGRSGGEEASNLTKPSDATNPSSARHSYSGRGIELSQSNDGAVDDAVASPASNPPYVDRKGKGRARDGDDRSPFSDVPNTSPTTASKRRSLKPTASHPIVTPGRAPSIRRTPAGMPSIVATDVDAPGAPHSHRPENANPFLSSNEAASSNGGNYPLDSIREGDTDEALTKSPTAANQHPPFARRGTSETVTTLGSKGTTVRPPSAASRMSMSKFREIGLDNDDDASGIQGYEDSEHGGQDAHSRARQRAAREAEEDRQRIKEGNGRQPWWTEWICGCGRVVDEDNEQTGKTGPE